jgi:hypothetical protein
MEENYRELIVILPGILLEPWRRPRETYQVYWMKFEPGTSSIQA